MGSIYGVLETLVTKYNHKPVVANKKKMLKDLHNYIFFYIRWKPMWKLLFTCSVDSIFILTWLPKLTNSFKIKGRKHYYFLCCQQPQRCEISSVSTIVKHSSIKSLKTIDFSFIIHSWRRSSPKMVKGHTCLSYFHQKKILHLSGCLLI